MSTSEIVLLETPRFTVVQDGKYYKINERALENGVVIVAQSVDGRFLLANLMRKAIDGFSFEFPRGAIDEGETAIQSAARELEEETGFLCDSLEQIGRLHSNTSLISSHVAVVFATVSKPASSYTDGEVESAQWVTPEGIDRMIVEGQITDGHTLSAWAIMRASNRG